MASKRKALSIREKAYVIHAIENGEKKSDVGRRLELSHSTVATIWKNKEAIRRAELEGKSSKKLRKPKFEELDQAILSWLKQQRKSNIPISGPIIKAKAKKLAEKLGIVNFKSSEGWLGKLKHRHNIIYGKINDEALDIDTNVTTSTGESEPPPTIQQALDAVKIIEKFLLFNQKSFTAYQEMAKCITKIRQS
ncbi:unnamed protein product [Leptosia nina]|uniref:Tigger transposable element-derived protein 4 n=1 Tax=Leptosia nina TaxID=320188 RepID=A0AAV1K0M8_9NEOP